MIVLKDVEHTGSGHRVLGGDVLVLGRSRQSGLPEIGIEGLFTSGLQDSSPFL